uniref:60S ribosomal protein L31 n=1 Tax=Bos indicus x Bos taurus TaxID=30522 RepID=A0A4W2CK10_BOBOX
IAPAEGGKKGHSAINEMVIRDDTINIHKYINGVGFKKKKEVPLALKEIWKYATKEMRTPYACTDRGLNKAAWAKKIRNVSYCI